MRQNKRKLWFLLLTTVLIICATLTLTIVKAQAKTINSAPASNIFFYVTNSDGKDVLMKVMTLQELTALQHGQLSGVTTGTDTGTNYYFSYTDNYPTTGYCEAKGITLPELAAYVKNTSPVAGASSIAYSGNDLMQFMATDSYGSYVKSWSYSVLYGTPRYYFSGMLSTTTGWNTGWEVGGDDLAKSGMDLDTYNTTYKAADVYYNAKRAAFNTGALSTPILATTSYAGRTTFSDGSSSEVGLAEEIAAHNGVVTGSLANKINQDYALRLCLPLTEADLMSGHRTAYDYFKWIYNIRLVMSTPPAITSLGTVASPTSFVSISADGNTMTITMACTTPGATIYYAVQDSNSDDDSAGAPQKQYTGPVTVDITGRNLASNPVTYYMTAVEAGYADNGIKTVNYYATAPAFQTVYSCNVGSSLIFTAASAVTSTDWTAWTSALTSVGIMAPGDSTYTAIPSTGYTINNTAKTITLNSSLFTKNGSYGFALYAAAYSNKTMNVTFSGAAPVINTASYYICGQAIALTFSDTAYQSAVTVKVTPPGSTTATTISPTYLDRTVAGKLTIKASYFSLATSKITGPGTYTLSITNTNFIPNTQTVTIKVINEADIPAYAYTLTYSNASSIAIGNTLHMTLTLTGKTAFELYGGEYRFTFDGTALSLNTSSISGSWDYGVKSDSATGLTTLTFIKLETANTGIAMNASTTLATFDLSVRKAGTFSMTPTVAILTDASAKLLDNVTAAAVSVTSTDTLGDLDEDGSITSSDVVMLINSLIGNITLSDKQLVAADVDEDGSITSSDAVRLVNYLVGNITAFSTESTAELALSSSSNSAALKKALNDTPLTVINNLLFTPVPHFLKLADTSTSAEAVISAAAVTAKPGETVIVPVTISQDSTLGFAGFTIAAAYDASVLTLNDITKGDALSNTQGWFSSSAATALVNWTSAENVTASGVLFNLSFTVKETAGLVNEPIVLSLKNNNSNNFVNNKGNAVKVMFSDGSISVLGNESADSTGGSDVSGGSTGGTGGSDVSGGSTSGSGSSVTGSTTKSFSDVDPDDWYAGAVDFVVKRGLFNGMGSNTFSPNSPMTRAMLVTVLSRLSGEKDSTATATPFSDVISGSWYDNAVAWASEKGIVTGYGDGCFGINDGITREQLVTIIYRYSAAYGYSVSHDADISGFGDSEKVSGWAAEAMKWAVGKAVLAGNDKNLLNPGGVATRAEVAVILQRWVELTES
jgi:hypothetical protein